MRKIEECYVIQKKDGYFYYDYEFIEECKTYKSAYKY